MIGARGSCDCTVRLLYFWRAIPTIKARVSYNGGSHFMIWRALYNRGALDFISVNHQKSTKF